MTFLGGRSAVVQLAQIAVTVLLAVVIWACFRHGVTVLATAALLVGAILATRYAFLYDLPIVSNAVLVFIRHKPGDIISASLQCAATCCRAGADLGAEFDQRDGRLDLD